MYRTAQADRIIMNLDKHLDYAENFIIGLYYSYGVEMSYFTLKDAKFTIQEIDKAEAIWKKKAKEQEIAAKKKAEQQEIAAREKAKQRERDILTRTRNNELFASSELTKIAKIAINVEDLAAYINAWHTKGIQNREILVECSFDFIVSKNKELSLKNPSEMLSFSESEQLIYQYIKNISKENIQPAIIELKYTGETFSVNSVINVRFNENTYVNRKEMYIEKNRKTKQWEIKTIANNGADRQKRLRENEADADFYMEFQKLLYSNPSFTSIKKGIYTTYFELSDHRIECTMDKKIIGEGKLGYSFKFTPPQKVQENKKWPYIVAGGVGLVLYIGLELMSQSQSQ